MGHRGPSDSCSCRRRPTYRFEAKVRFLGGSRVGSRRKIAMKSYLDVSARQVPRWIAAAVFLKWGSKIKQFLNCLMIKKWIFGLIFNMQCAVYDLNGPFGVTQTGSNCVDHFGDTEFCKHVCCRISCNVFTKTSKHIKTYPTANHFRIFLRISQRCATTTNKDAPQH